MNLVKLDTPPQLHDPEYCRVINDGALNPFIVRTNPARVRPERELEIINEKRTGGKINAGK